MSNFYKQLPNPFFSLAPMEGVTDIVFRQVVAQAGRPDLFYTEFTHVDSFASAKGKHSALERLEFLPEEQPIVAQIWGTKPKNFAITCQGLEAMGYQAVDVNTGCPDKTAIKSGGGAALIRDPELTSQIINSCQSSNLAVSVKTRLGYSRVEEWLDWITFLFNHRPDCLTVHLRTKKEMSKVSAHHELIPELIKLRDQIAPDTKLAINGDVINKAEARQLVENHPGLDGVMIGRGVFGNPYCFTDHIPNQSELLKLLHLHLNLFDKHRPNGNFAPLKRFFKIYLRDFDGAKELRAKLMETNSTIEARQVLDREGK